MKTFPYFLLKNWWMIACMLMSWGVFIQVIHKKNKLVHILKERVKEIEYACEKTQDKKNEFILRKQSQNDRESLELILKEKLDVIPEGQTKVIFK